MERLQKVLARAGIASRRAAEQIILAGRVRVDGRVVRELGTQVDERKSRVEVDGTKIVAEKLVYIVLHKPRGVVCTLSDPEGRPTIRELLKDAGARVVPVGRLDFHTSGALLCTNDGEFAQGLAHPKREVPKVYVAKVKGTVDDDALERLRESIVIDGRPTQPAEVKRLRYEGDKTWLEITLREGRNRQVRRLGEATGFPVMRLARISQAGVSSEDLRPGQWRPLSVDELVDLKKSYGVPKKVRAPELALALAAHAKSERRAPRTSAWTKGEGRATRGAGQATKGERWATKGEGRGTRAEGRTTKSEGWATKSEGWATKSEGRGTRGEGRGTRGEGRTTRSEGWATKSEGWATKGERKPFRAQEPSSHASNRAGSFRGNREPRSGGKSAAGARRPGEHAPQFAAPANRARSVDRKAPYPGARTSSARRDDAERPWKARSRTAGERRPEIDTAKPNAGRVPGRKLGRGR